MKLILALLLVGIKSFAFNAIISGSIATTYSTPPSTLSNLTLRATPTLMIANANSCRICANTISTLSPAPTAGNGKEYCVPANAIAFWDDVDAPRGPANVYVRADVSTCTTTTPLDVNIW